MRRVKGEQVRYLTKAELVTVLESAAALLEEFGQRRQGHDEGLRPNDAIGMARVMLDGRYQRDLRALAKRVSAPSAPYGSWMYHHRLRWMILKGWENADGAVKFYLPGRWSPSNDSPKILRQLAQILRQELAKDTPE